MRRLLAMIFALRILNLLMIPHRTTAKKKGMGTKPGNTSLGDISSCGGGGAGFGGGVSAREMARD